MIRSLQRRRFGIGAASVAVATALPTWLVTAAYTASAALASQKAYFARYPMVNPDSTRTARSIHSAPFSWAW